MADDEKQEVTVCVTCDDEKKFPIIGFLHKKALTIR
jgi:hypothetical protein